MRKSSVQASQPRGNSGGLTAAKEENGGVADLKKAVVWGDDNFLQPVLLGVLRAEGWEVTEVESRGENLKSKPDDLFEKGKNLFQIGSTIFLVPKLNQLKMEVGAQASIVKRLVEAAGQTDSQVVLFSSDSIFEPGGGPFKEEDFPRPRTWEGKNLLEIEMLVRGGSPFWLIVRSSSVFGWNPISNNQAMQVYRGLASGKTIKLPAGPLSTPTLVDWLAEVTLRLVEQKVHGVINVAGRDLVSPGEFGRQMAKAFVQDSNLIQEDREVGGDDKTNNILKGGLSTRRLETILGTGAMSLDEAGKRIRRHRDQC